MSRSGSSREAEHHAAVSVSFELAVEAPEHTPYFSQCHRNGERKRVFDSPTPEHHFHLQYQLLPVGDGGEEERGGLSKSDVVTFGLVSKVYTEKDARVVRCWEEVEDEEERVESKDDDKEAKELEEGNEEKKTKRRSHFGWRHKHSFRVTRALLLELYDHTLEVRLWNSKEKLAPRARFDRPRAFRLSAPKKDGEWEGERPAKFSVVGQQMEQVSHRGRRRARIAKKASNLSVLSEGESDLDLSSISEVPHSPTKPAAPLEQIPEGDSSAPLTDHSAPSVTTEDHSVPLVADQNQPSMTTGELSVPALDHKTTALMPHYSIGDIHVTAAGSSLFALHGISRHKVRQLEVEVAEKVRVEREGLVVLRLRMADLFAKRDSIVTKMDSPIANIKVFEVRVSLNSPLMPDSLRRDLNPTTITVQHASGMPAHHFTEQRERCDPVYVKYQFHHLPEHHTPGHTHSRDITWDDSHVILLGTINREFLAEYLRGPPLTMEVHDRDRCLEKAQEEAVFGTERRDELLGTHAFGTGVGACDTVRGLSRPWDSFGTARFNLDSLLDGQRMVQLTAPIITGPRAPPSREDCRVGPHGRELPEPLPPADFLHSQSNLTITVELSHPLPPHTLTTSPEAPLTTTTCPFTRLVYVTLADEAGQILVRRILDHVNESNAATLGLGELPGDLLMTALSTYKLTKSEMEGGGCDVVTGFQVRDGEVSVLVVEGLRDGAISRMWAQLPRHSTQDAGLVRVFYNSGHSFSQRLYGSLDVDLPLITLPLSLSTLTQLPLLYIRGNVTPAALRALLCLMEMTRTESGTGMAELVRNELFPSADEVSALAMQFGVLPGEEWRDDTRCSEGSRSSSHTPVPVCEGGGGRRERVKVKVPLDMSNRDYEALLADRKGHPVDHINRNITHVYTLSEQSAQLPTSRRRGRRRAHSDTLPVHNYSLQTLNSVVLAKARLRAELAASSDDRQLYTYCQDYHSMTFEPIDTDSEKKAQRLASQQKWRTREGFVYPGVPHARESSSHHHLHPHPGRSQELTEPFTDGLLHTNTMKPTVDRLHFSWERRGDDFDRHSRLPNEFGPPLPISIHLAGQRRAREAQLSEQQARREWEGRVVVSDTRFHTYRRGIQTEMHETATQLSRLEDILKSSPDKYSLRKEGLRLAPVPALHVVQNPSLDRGTQTVREEEEGEEEGEEEEEGEREGKGGYQPGPVEKGSLKRDGNVVPLRYQRTRSHSEGWKNKHSQDFRLFYHTHSPLNKRHILPLSSSEKHPPLFPTTSPTIITSQQTAQ